LDELQGDEAVAPNLLGAIMEADELLSVSPLLFSLLTRPGELRTANGLFPAPVKIFGLENTDPPVRYQSLSLINIITK
jgi:hypothetical protein